jgi:hypothetical protein
MITCPEYRNGCCITIHPHGVILRKTISDLLLDCVYNNGRFVACPFVEMLKSADGMA